MGLSGASIGQVYEFPIAPSGYPAAVGNRYLIYESDGDLLIGRNLTDPNGIDIHGSAEAWPKAARLVVVAPPSPPVGADDEHTPRGQG